MEILVQVRVVGRNGGVKTLFAIFVFTGDLGTIDSDVANAALNPSKRDVDAKARSRRLMVLSPRLWSAGADLRWSGGPLSQAGGL